MDLCVIDEIQMIADPLRGSVWTNAVLGVLAHEIHLCGEESRSIYTKWWKSLVMNWKLKI